MPNRRWKRKPMPSTDPDRTGKIGAKKTGDFICLRCNKACSTVVFRGSWTGLPHWVCEECYSNLKGDGE